MAKKSTGTTPFNTLALSLAHICHAKLNAQHPADSLDGDQTAEIARLFLRHLDLLNGNV